jgi:hypothetical protein
MKPKYIPDMATVLREMDPAVRKRNRELAARSLERPTPPMFFQAGTQAGEEMEKEARVSAPSPWGEGGAGAGAGAGEIDKAELPSALGPAAAEGEAVPYVVPRKKAPAIGAVKARRSWMIVAACLAIGVAMPVVLVLMGGTTQRGATVAGGASHVGAAVSEAAVAPVAPAMTVAPQVPAASASAAAAPTVTPSARPTTSSAPRAPGGLKPSPKPAPTVDPGTPAPSPAPEPAPAPKSPSNVGPLLNE